MNSYAWIMLLLVGRYIHIVCTTLLVGGTLFYEMVVPVAISDLREEQQLLIFARARWMFKWIVWLSVFLILGSGAISSIAHWKQYTNSSYYQIGEPTTQQAPTEVSIAGRAGMWWIIHVSAGVLTMLVSLSLTIGSIPPRHPIAWMRLNLIALFLVIFLATATRQARLQAEDRHSPTITQNEIRE